MAHGAPDWWSRGHMDIILQTLQYLIIKPYYGDSKVLSSCTSVPDTTWTQLFKIEGKGRIYGGIIRSGAEEPTHPAFRVYLDGDEAGWFDLGEMLKAKLFPPASSFLRVLCKQAAVPFFVVDLLPNIQFEDSLEVQFWHDSGANRTICYEIYYGLAT